jgi:tRNA A37 threonylcarbamoyladenosine dehydratase
VDNGALARSSVAALTLIDLDHVAGVDVNRQCRRSAAPSAWPGPGAAGASPTSTRLPRSCDREFVTRPTGPGLLPAAVDAVVDACDQGRARRRRRLGTGCARAARHRRRRWRSRPRRVEVGDLATTRARPGARCLRQRLRKFHPRR